MTIIFKILVVFLSIGEDTRFDEAILDYKYRLFLFDPTPRSASYVKTRRKLMAEFEQIAVSDHDSEHGLYR